MERTKGKTETKRTWSKERLWKSQPVDARYTMINQCPFRLNTGLRWLILYGGPLGRESTLMSTFSFPKIRKKSGATLGMEVEGAFPGGDETTGPRMVVEVLQALHENSTEAVSILQVGILVLTCSLFLLSAQKVPLCSERRVP